MKYSRIMTMANCTYMVLFLTKIIYIYLTNFNILKVLVRYHISLVVIQTRLYTLTQNLLKMKMSIYVYVLPVIENTILYTIFQCSLWIWFHELTAQWESVIANNVKRKRICWRKVQFSLV